MASIVSPKNVGKLIIATAVATETTNSTFVTGATIGEVAVVKADGAAIVANQPFKFVHKKDASLTGVDFSDTVDPKQIDFVKVKAYEAEQAQITVVSGFTGTPIANATYRVSIRKYDGIGSPENFRHVHGFVVTPVNNTLTYPQILAQLRDNINASLKRDNEFKEIQVSVVDTTLVFTGQVQSFYLGKDAGDPVYFDIETSIKDNSPATLAEAGTSYTGILTVENTQGVKAGVGTGKQVAQTEYSWRGYENGDYGREMGFPNNFNVTPLANPALNYDTLVIGFHKDREGVNVERQFKELIVVTPEGAGGINALLAKLRVVAPNVVIPADLEDGE